MQRQCISGRSLGLLSATFFIGSLSLLGQFAVATRERSKLLAALQESEQRYQQVLDERLEMLMRQAYYDQLTSLPNRTLFMDRLNHALRRAIRQHTGLAVLFLDLDGFKQVNDTLGHQAGDVLLNQLGQRLLGCVRPGDTLARLGGDEFSALLENVADVNVAQKVAERIVSALESPFLLDEQPVTVGVSVGVAWCEAGSPATEPALLLREADTALYQAKAAGRGRVAVALEAASGR